MTKERQGGKGRSDKKIDKERQFGQRVEDGQQRGKDTRETVKKTTEGQSDQGRVQDD
jgi:hypothetical protein